MPCVPNIPSRFVRSQIGARALVEERTVQKYYRDPSAVRPAIAEQIRRALATLGYTDPHAGKVSP
jgi:hypothetical protein